MFTTNVVDYTNILDKAADASWMRENVITNNIANIDTPGYKRQDVDFESVLQKALGKTKYSSLDKKVWVLFLFFVFFFSGETYNDILYRCGKLFLST